MRLIIDSSVSKVFVHPHRALSMKAKTMMLGGLLTAVVALSFQL
jgi:hypothetical protein